jgi:hypothetical protein
MDLDIGSLVLLVFLLLVPAAVIFTVFTVARVRRGKFHRQRITKGAGKTR